MENAQDEGVTYLDEVDETVVEEIHENIEVTDQKSHCVNTRILDSDDDFEDTTEYHLTNFSDYIVENEYHMSDHDHEKEQYDVEMTPYEDDVNNNNISLQDDIQHEFDEIFPPIHINEGQSLLVALTERYSAYFANLTTTILRDAKGDASVLEYFSKELKNMAKSLITSHAYEFSEQEFEILNAPGKILEFQKIKLKI